MLDPVEMCFFNGLSALEEGNEDVGGFHRIPDRVVDADSSHRCHDVGGVADEEKSGLRPGSKSAALDVKKLELLPVVQLRDGTFMEKGRGDSNFLVKRRQSRLPDLSEIARVDHRGNLIVIRVVPGG